MPFWSADPEHDIGDTITGRGKNGLPVFLGYYETPSESILYSLDPFIDPLHNNLVLNALHAIK
jgi:hypothetical protein